MSQDVVAELDRWANDTRRLPGGDAGTDLLKRARDEIVALRAVLDIQKRLPDKIAANVRDAALEEAARVCEGGYTTGSTASTLKAVAAAIRALKKTL